MHLKFGKTGLLAVLAITVTAGAAKNDKSVVVALKNGAGQDAGTATFSPEKDGAVKLVLALKNVSTGNHGVHIHQNPACDAPDFKTAGPHFNPDGKQHGPKNPMGPHAGDLPKNVAVSVDGDKTTLLLKGISMGTGAANDILAKGASIVVHEKEDDMKTDPSGNSGNRIACGVIAAGAQP